MKNPRQMLAISLAEADSIAHHSDSLLGSTYLTKVLPAGHTLLIPIPTIPIPCPYHAHTMPSNAMPSIPFGSDFNFKWLICVVRTENQLQWIFLSMERFYSGLFQWKMYNGKFIFGWMLYAIQWRMVCTRVHKIHYT